MGGRQGGWWWWRAGASSLHVPPTSSILINPKLLIRGWPRRGSVGVCLVLRHWCHQTYILHIKVPTTCINHSCAHLLSADHLSLIPSLLVSLLSHWQHIPCGFSTCNSFTVIIILSVIIYAVLASAFTVMSKTITLLRGPGIIATIT